MCLYHMELPACPWWCPSHPNNINDPTWEERLHVDSAAVILMMMKYRKH